MKNTSTAIFCILIIAMCASCKSRQTGFKNNTNIVSLITLNPGHFHAALVQKTMYPNVDSVVHVYASPGNDVQQHLDKIIAYNNRKENPTYWKEEVYTGNNYLEKMIAQKKGNVVVISGNNKKKTEYIKQSVDAGLNVLADKPMAIDAANFKMLQQAFADAKKKDVLLYDIMTERYEITNKLQKDFAALPEVFGTLENGTSVNPAIIINSVHYLYKYVSGNVLVRPAWFMDVTQEGEGITDVATHLVDLIQWECFPEQIIDYRKDIEINSARHWSTNLSLSQFNAVTKEEAFPAFLKSNITQDSMLPIYCNGEFTYTIKNVYAKVTASWDYKAPEGSGDTHYSLLRGTKANLVIMQGNEQHYKPVLYIEPVVKDEAYKRSLMEQIKLIQQEFPGVELKETDKGWEVIVPERYSEGHEAHFARVTEKFLQYLQQKTLPAWEVPNMIAKYYTTTTALEMAKKNTSQ